MATDPTAGGMAGKGAAGEQARALEQARDRAVVMAGAKKAESIGVFCRGIPFYHKHKEDISCQD